MTRLLTRSNLVVVGFVVLLLGAIRVPAQVRHHTRGRFAFPSVGIVNGESLVISIASLHGGYPPDPCRIVLIDPEGKVVFDTGVFQLPAVQTQAFAINWGDLPVSPNALLGRIQVRAVVFVNAPNGFPEDPCLPSVELVQAATGQTVAIQAAPALEFLD